MRKHCADCHGDDLQEGSLTLAPFTDSTAIIKGRKTWQTILRRIESGEMPPEDRPRPKQDEIAAFVKLVRDIYDAYDRTAKPDPGRVTVRRLNRTEYNNTIRDLVGVDFSPAEDFPSDDIGHGFDNIGDVLTLSPVLMERYFAAAESIVQRAILPSPPPPPKRFLSARYTEPAGKDVPQSKFRPIATDGEQPIHTGPLNTAYKVPGDGEYIVRARVYGESKDGQPVRAALLAKGAEVATPAGDDDVARIAGHSVERMRPMLILETFDVTATSADKPQTLEATIPANIGFERAAVALLKPAEGQPAVKLHVEWIALEGPLDTRPRSHRELLAVTPGASQAEQTREVIERFARRAYRRPVSEIEVDRLVTLCDDAMAEGLSWEAGIQRVLLAVLVSPKFLFRFELDDRPQSPEPRPLDEYQLASRLSYFLWSTMPDDELFALAEKKQLTANLDAQVKRMLKDPRSRQLVENFGLQWLQLQRLQSFSPDLERFPTFSEKLRDAMLRETVLFFSEVVREDRSILDLLEADFTYMNETLARHYGVVDTMGARAGQKPVRPGGQRIRGDEFVRVSLADNQRGGLPTQASVLTVTSNPTRTSPVKRGKWILEQILGDPPPPPPPNVPELEENDQAVLSGSLRQRLEQHRANPACAACHDRMDPIGFAFENYDAIGKFRDKDGEFEIETAGELPDGAQFAGPGEFKQVLRERKDQFSRCVIEKLLTYALGRGLEYYDRPVVDRIQKQVADNDYRFSALISEIVRSQPFRLRRGLESAP
ncbi:MAG: DUF1592 domain-containing protein [Pirellulaceae bacterium]